MDASTTLILLPAAHIIRRAVALALEEDLGQGDVTTQSTVPPDVDVRGVIIARATGVIAGLPVAQAVFSDTILFVTADNNRCRIQFRKLCD